MAEFDQGVKMIAATTGQQLARVAGVESRRWGPLESTLQVTTEFLADRAFRAMQGRERFVVYFEFYTTWDRNAPWDMLAKSGLLSQREHLPTVCIPVVLQRRGYRPQNGQLRLTAAGGPTQHLWFREVRLWETDPAPWWEDVPGLMALFPLCRHGRQPLQAIQHAARTIERKLPASGERNDVLSLLGIFGGLAFPRLDVAGIIGREMMKESRFVREFKDEGRIENARAFILDLLQTRFGPEVTTDVDSVVNALTDLETLTRLHRLAANCGGLDEFRAALPRPDQPSERPSRRRGRGTGRPE